MLRRWAWSKGLAGTLSQKTNRLSVPKYSQHCCFVVKQLPDKQPYVHAYAGSIPAHVMHIMPNCARLIPIMPELRTDQIRVPDCQNTRKPIKERSPINQTPAPSLINSIDLGDTSDHPWVSHSWGRHDYRPQENPQSHISSPSRGHVPQDASYLYGFAPGYPQKPKGAQDERSRTQSNGS